MQFLTLRLGDPQLSFGPSSTARLPFSFPRPVEGVHALLQSVHLDREDEDVELKEVRVSAQPLFDRLQSATDGEIQVDLQFTGSRGWSPFLSPDLIRVDIRILVIGV